MTASAELMTRAQAGDIDAFGEIYTRYLPEVRRIVYKRLPRFAEDIVQDVFVKALGNLHTYHDTGRDPGAWINTIAVNLCRDRGVSAYVTRVEPSADAGADLATTPEAGPERLTIDRMQRDEMQALLARLPDKLREALVLFYLHDMSVVDVAQAVGRTTGSVKAALSRGRRLMAAQLTAVADA